MTVGFQNYGYSNYPSTNYLNQTQQQSANTSIQSSATNTKKSNKGAIAAGLTVTAGIALTAFAASKGKKLTGQDKLLANLKAGFNQIKDDVVKFAQTKLKSFTQNADEAGEAVQGAIKPNDTERGLSTFVNTVTNTGEQATTTNVGIKDKITETIKKGVDKAKQMWNDFKSTKNPTWITEEGLEITQYADNSYRGIKIN